MAWTFSITNRNSDCHFDYIGASWDIFRYTYFFYKIYHKERFHLYDASWLFTKLYVNIDKKTNKLVNVNLSIL